MRKHCIGIILSVILIFTMTVISFAELSAKIDVKISTTDLSYTLMATVTDAGDSTLTYQWYESTPDGYNNILIAGATGNVYQPTPAPEKKYYYCEVTATSEEGTFKVSTDIAEVVDKSAGVKEESKEIMTASIKDIEVPAIGEKPDYNASTGIGDAGFIITNIQWSPSVNEFEPETEYSVTVSIKLNTNCVAGNGFKGLINDNPAEIIGDTASGEFALKYTFPATEKVEPVLIDETDETEGIANLPSPLGIPGWIWVIIIVVLIAALIVAIIAANKAKKSNAVNHNYVNEIYEEKMKKKETMAINSDKIRREGLLMREEELQRRKHSASKNDYSKYDEDSSVSNDVNNISYYDANSEIKDFDALNKTNDDPTIEDFLKE